MNLKLRKSEKIMKNKIISLLLLLITVLTVSSCTINLNIGQGGGGEQNGGEADCLHADVNDDGECDKCFDSLLVVIDFYAINDLHGKLLDTDSQPGVDELTTYLKKRGDIDEHTVLISSGDMWQGSSESNLTRGKIVTEWMNELDFVSMTIGNHEFDWGEEYIEENLKAAEFPFLAINIYERETNTPVDYCAPSVMIERGGIQIGIIGAIGDCYSSISPDKVEDVYFKTGDELTELIKDEATRLRDGGADLIIYSLHDGYGSSGSSGGMISSNRISSYYDPSLSQGYIDLVFEGHTHQRYVFHDTYDVYHLQNGGENKGISHAEIAINQITGTLVVTEASFISTSNYTGLEDDPIVNDLKDKYGDDIAKGDEVLGFNPSYKDDYYVCGKVAELYADFGVRTWGDEYDIVLGGGYLSLRSPYSLGEGEIRYSDLQMILPFDNKLALCSVKGEDLLRKFINTSNSNYHIYYTEYGASIKEKIDTDATYYIIVDMYTALYAPNKLTLIEEYPEEIYARDLLGEYIKTVGLK